MGLDPTTPFRLGIGATRLGLHVAERALRIPVDLIDGLLGRHDHIQDSRIFEPDAEIAVPDEPEITEPDPGPAPDPEPAPQPIEPVPQPDAPPLEPEEPAHVEVETELVGEFAEPGAEDGAGAEVHVDEPWEGYRRMRVADIQDRVMVASAAELAVIDLYERFNRNRRSVIDAVERRSRALANDPTARVNGR